jgi:hypothetical protein
MDVTGVYRENVQPYHKSLDKFYNIEEHLYSLQYRRFWVRRLLTDRVVPKIIRACSVLITQLKRYNNKHWWVMLICPNGTNCCFSELAWQMFNSVCWSSILHISSSLHRKITCFRYDRTVKKITCFRYDRTVKKITCFRMAELSKNNLRSLIEL